MLKQKPLPFHLDLRFMRYAVLTGSAILAARPAKADVVYTVEPTPIDFNTGTHSLDLNGDGTVDFFFTGGFGGSLFIEVHANSFFVSGTASSFFADGIAVQLPDSAEAASFGTGTVIGSDQFYAVIENMGNFSATGNLFEGFEFYDTVGHLYYGFAEFDPGNLVGYAYETTPNTSITTFDLTTPEPGTLAMLALGAAGLVALKRRRRQP